MALLEIKKYPFDSLRQKASPVTESDLKDKSFREFTFNLMETLEHEFPLGAGLAANQVDILKRVVAINLELDEDNILKQILINPEVVWQSKNTEIDWEGCLSFPDQWGQVNRPGEVKIKAQNLNGEPFEIKANNFYARLLQHEIDHLNGVLFIDKLESELIDTQTLDRIIKKDNTHSDPTDFSADIAKIPA